MKTIATVTASILLTAALVSGVAWAIGSDQGTALDHGQGLPRKVFQLTTYDGDFGEGLSMDTERKFKPINVGRMNQCEISVFYTWDDMPAFQLQCEHSDTGARDTWSPVPEFTKNSTTNSQIDGAQRVMNWPTTASGAASFMVPVIKEYLRCTIPDSTGSADNELENATATCGGM